MTPLFLAIAHYLKKTTAAPATRVPGPLTPSPSLERRVRMDARKSANSGPDNFGASLGVSGGEPSTAPKAPDLR